MSVEGECRWKLTSGSNESKRKAMSRREEGEEERSEGKVVDGGESSLGSFTGEEESQIEA